MSPSNGRMLSAGMRSEEYARLKELLLEVKPAATLEIGMANGGSTQVICEVLRDSDGRHTAIDPFQNAKEGWSGQGLERLRQHGLLEYCELIEDFDYLALPRLVAAKKSYDFILIDGWHSFDYTMI